MVGDVIMLKESYLLFLLPFFWPFILPIIVASKSKINILALFVVAILLQILYIYSLSCILIWLFGKMKRNKTKRKS